MAMAVNASDGEDDSHVLLATLSDRGTERENNEDACGTYREHGGCSLLVVADGVSGNEGGEVASQMAVATTIETFRESPRSWGPAKRLYRAVQRANIEIHDRALLVTEIGRMSTTLTAMVVEGGMVHAAHVGDTRLYLLRDGNLLQKTKDHTVAGGRERMGLSVRPKGHVDRSTLTRSVGRELIAAIDRITFRLAKNDVILLCSDGVYNVLDDADLIDALGASDPGQACAAIIRSANVRGAPDNLTAAVLHFLGEPAPAKVGWRNVFGRLLGRS
jgi:PPM family protein phosphatase